jgi:hypothetical protein
VKLRSYIAVVGGLLIVVGAGLLLAWKITAVDCERIHSVSACANPALWIPGVVCAAIGLVVLIGALITKSD